MVKDMIKEIVEKFNLKNDLTENIRIWVGHAKIGYKDRISIEDAKKLLENQFNNKVTEGEPTPEKLKKSIMQWENFHPFQKVREIDQPLYYNIDGQKLTVAVIWPWQMKHGVASLMLYEGRFLE